MEVQDKSNPPKISRGRLKAQNSADSRPYSCNRNMFSIAAINDTDSTGQWEPLAPTKEAQEFHLSQTYHDGLLKLHAKEYDKAQELLESVLKDPLISNAQVDNGASDGHLLQLRFLALKNLATVFLQQGSSHHESALHCYLQAVEIDTNDSVLWNQLGTLSCSMGLLSISRWAFEQGLVCSPNNWNCMEKLLEVLIAIGDEVACLSVAELILRHWPSHSRALHVKTTIEESEPVPFAPRGIDKLEPKHNRLKFVDKRKAHAENQDEVVVHKKLNRSIELRLAEASWVALSDSLLKILHPLSGHGTEMGTENAYLSGDVKIIIHIPSSSETVMQTMEKKGPMVTPNCEVMALGDCNAERAAGTKEKDAACFDEHPQERRSTRLERLRSRKPEKEEIDFANSKNPAESVLQYLESFIVSKSESKGLDSTVNFSDSFSDQMCSLNPEDTDVANFVRDNSKNYGAYHMGHLLLEYAANKPLTFQDAFVKFLELEKLTRHWGQDRTPECSLFLAELYYDLGSAPCSVSNRSALVSEASYHLCKVIESVALSNSFHLNFVSGNGSYSSVGNFQGSNEIADSNSAMHNSSLDNLLVSNKSSFWARFFWLSGQLSSYEGRKEKAHEEFCISLSLLERKENPKDSLFSVPLPHCKLVKKLTVSRVLYEINLIKVDFLLEKTLSEMIEREMYMECVNLLAPLLFSTNDVLPLPSADKKSDGIISVELPALDILIEACEKMKKMDVEVYLNCHRRKLQILMMLGGTDECLVSCKPFHQKAESKLLSASDVALRNNSNVHQNSLVAEEVKAVLQCVSRAKNFIDQSGDANGIVYPVSIIGDLQSLLLAVMLNVARNFLSKKSLEPVIADQSEQKQKCCFLSAAIAFCKLQHLNSTIPVKTQVELIVGLHDLLAEYGLCCVGEDGEGEEGMFLKFAIKHLLALDMRLKSNINPLNRGRIPCDKTSQNRTDMLDAGVGEAETISVKKDDCEGINSKDSTSNLILEKDDVGDQFSHDGNLNKGEEGNGVLTDHANELTEDEKDELELMIDTALDQCFFCLYGLNLRCDSSYEDDLAVHKNTSRGDYQTKEQCADVFQYILPYAKASSRTGLVKLRRVLRAIRKHFPQPPDDVLAGNPIDKFLDDPDLCEDKLSEEAGSDVYLETITNIIFSGVGSLKQYKASLFRSSGPYMDVYCNLYYLLAQSEEISATDKWPGFVLTKEGEEFVQQNANLFKYDILYNPFRFESWQKLANIYDEEVDLLLNDGSKHINVAGWRKNATLPLRVETSRRRSRRCLLVSLALAKTSNQQCEIHELLALVYYDSLQNVVPFYDQRTFVPSRDSAWMMFCESSLRHFKKAFSHKQDWSHAFYMGKLCEKLGYPLEISLSYYDKAMALNPSAVDPVYRMHASRLKLLCTFGKENVETLKILSTYCFDKSTREAVVSIINEQAPETSNILEYIKDGILQENSEGKYEQVPMEEVWRMLYNDCLSALEICVEGDLKHFHKARFMLAQGLYKRGGIGDLQRAKDELSFCFKSSRSSFTINMWEIDGMVKKGRRKTPALAGNRKALEVNLPESSRKFITCIRKYLLFYLKLLEETRDICTLDRAYVSLRSDKRFSLCIEDLVPVAIGRYIKALLVSMCDADISGFGTSNSSEHQLEKIFTIFMEQGTLWPEICSLTEFKTAETSESSLYGYLHQYIVLLEKNGKLEMLEGINDKLRKRFKNPKLSNSNCAKVCRHASVAWCRSLVVSLALITPLQSGLPIDTQINQMDGENTPLLFIDIQPNEIWNSSFENSTQLDSLEAKWSPTLTKIKNLAVKKVVDDKLESANSLLRSSYNFYRETSCVMLPSGVNLYLVPSRSVTEAKFHLGVEGVEILDLSIPRKLLLWAFTLLHGRYANISYVVKHCEEIAKLRMKKGSGTSSMLSNTGQPTAVSIHIGGASHGGSSETEGAPASRVASFLLSELESTSSTVPMPSGEIQKGLFTTPQLHHCSNLVSEKSSQAYGGDPHDKG